MDVYAKIIFLVGILFMIILIGSVNFTSYSQSQENCDFYKSLGYHTKIDSNINFYHCYVEINNVYVNSYVLEKNGYVPQNQLRGK
jgi:hypothetical protein